MTTSKIIHLGNLRLLTSKKGFSQLSEALSEALEMIKFGVQSSTFQLMSQDVFITKEADTLIVSRPIIGYMPRSDIYKTQDKNGRDYSSVEVLDADAAVGLLMAEEINSSHLRISDDKFYFEVPHLN